MEKMIISKHKKKLILILIRQFISFENSHLNPNIKSENRNYSENTYILILINLLALISL